MGKGLRNRTAKAARKPHEVAHFEKESGNLEHRERHTNDMLLTAFTSIQEAEAALDRYSRFMSKVRTLAVDVKAKYSGSDSIGTAQLILSRPSSVKFSGQWGGTSFLYTQSPNGAIELDRTLGRYREYGRASGILPPTGEVAKPAPTAFPGIVLVPDLRRVIPPGKMFSVVRSTPGLKATTVDCEFEIQGGRIHIWFKIDELGRLIFSKQVRSGTSGSETLELYYTNWHVNKAYPAKLFDIDPPLGTRPDVLPSPPDSMTVGQQFPISESLKFKSGWQRISAFAGGKPVLVSLIDKGCQPSHAFHVWLERNNPILSKKVKLLAISRGAGRAFTGKVPVAEQPSGSLWAKLNLPGTPSLYLVDSKGKIAKLWFGFDASSQASLLKEVNFEITVLGSR